MRTKSTDMNASWVKNRCDQGQFEEITWAPGNTDLANITLACVIAKSDPFNYSLKAKAPPLCRGVTES